jgi:hypothetical protein
MPNLPEEIASAAVEECAKAIERFATESEALSGI